MGGSAIRWQRVGPVLIVAAAFGPYVSQSAGIRTEQIAVYALATAAALTFLTRPIVHQAVALPLLAWCGYILTLVVSAVSRPPTVAGLTHGQSFLASMDNVVLPVAALLIANWWLTSRDANPSAIAGTLVSSIVVFMAANALIALVTLQVNLSPVLAHFWSAQSSGGGIAVATRALSVGRYTGIFNEPAEAGIAYSVALAGTVYMFAARSVRPVALVVLGGLLTIGGLLTVSKIFIVIGLPLAGLQLARQGGRRFLIFVSMMALGVVAWGTTSLHWLQWQGQASLSALLSSSNTRGLVDLYSGGRLGAGGVLTSGFRSVLNTSPWFGFGVRGLPIAYDSAWLAAIITAGILGVAAMVGVYASFPTLWLRSRRDMPAPVRRFAGALILVTIGASIGVPSLTSNRVSTLLWLLLPVVLATGPKYRLSREAGARAEWAAGLANVNGPNSRAESRPGSRLPVQSQSTLSPTG